jgi:Holliday junction resolvasome RuvABC endonuclease subunit
MNQKRSNSSIILAVALSSWGVGFAVTEGKDVLVDWGMTATKGDKNVVAACEVEKLIAQYRPSVFVMEDAHAKDAERSVRIRFLAKRLFAVAARAKIKTAVMPREEIRKAFFQDGLGTKDALAAAVAESFPEELGRLLPRKRKAWMNEHFRMAMFEAVAGALAFGNAAK